MLIGVPVGIALLGRRSAALAAAAGAAAGAGRRRRWAGSAATTTSTPATRATEDFRFQLDDAAAWAKETTGERIGVAGTQRRLQPVHPLRRRALEPRPVHRPRSSRPATSARSRTLPGASFASRQRRRLRLRRHHPRARPERPRHRQGLARGRLAARRHRRRGGAAHGPASRSSGSTASSTRLTARTRGEARRRPAKPELGGEYLLGMAALAVVAVSIGGRRPHASPRAAARLDGRTRAARRRRPRHSACWSSISELLGLFGLLDGVLLTAACVIVGVGRAADRADADAGQEDQRRGGPGRPARGRRGPVLGGVAAIGFAVVVAVQWAGPTLLALDRGIYGGDSLWYHMPFAAHIARNRVGHRAALHRPALPQLALPAELRAAPRRRADAARQRLPLAAAEPRLARRRAVRRLVHRPPLRGRRRRRSARSPR